MDKYGDTKILLPEATKRGVPTLRILFVLIGILFTALVVLCGVWISRNWHAERLVFKVGRVHSDVHENILEVDIQSQRYNNDDHLNHKPSYEHPSFERLTFEHTIINKQCDVISDDYRFDCYPEDGSTADKCAARGCCWSPPKKPHVKSPGSIGVPYCFYPTDYPQYYIVNQTKTKYELTAFLARNTSSYYPNDIKLLRLDITPFGEALRAKIYDPLNPRYEIPYKLKQTGIKTSLEQSNLGIEVKNFPFSFKIFRKDNNQTLFNIGYGAFIYTDQFIQFSTNIFSHVYGLGERRDNFLRSLDWQRFTFFAVDQAPVSNSNLYGSHPFMLQIGPNGLSFGTLLYNSNAMEVILQPAPAATYRTLGGILDLVFFPGPTPADVIRQYLNVIGLPAMPPFWSLGFHLCRFGLKTVSDTRTLLQRTRNAGIPFDVQWNDIDYMDNRRDFTYDKVNYNTLPQLVDEIHQLGMRYVVITDSAMDTPKDPHSYPPYADGLKRGIFINGSDGKPFIGKVWSPEGAAWPDFINPATTDFWTDQINEFHKEVPFDGLWIDMNEPSNFYDGTKMGCPTSRYENPPYVPHVAGGKLNSKTVCMTTRQHLGIHYNLHNLYGYSETIATNTALRKTIPGKRPFIISRSTFPGQGHYGGHWTGDIFSTWDDMKKSIPGILDSNLFGIPMVGADICGFNGNTTVKLCQRWMELGAFYPFSRNHNTDDAIDQDPVALGPEVVRASINALSLRYFILPYMYTLFYRAHLYGETVARPLFFEFTQDTKTYAIDTQFLLGPAFMILPVLEEDQIQVNAYLPRGHWLVIGDEGRGQYVNSTGADYVFSSPPETIVVALRDGYIIPAKLDALTTSEMRKLPFVLLVVLDDNGNSKGELFWDDGESIDSIDKGNYNLINFTSHNNTIQSSVIKAGAEKELMTLDLVRIANVKSSPTDVRVNNKTVKFGFDQEQKLLEVSFSAINLLTPFTLTWN